jgi:hypothetical protein
MTNLLKLLAYWALLFLGVLALAGVFGLGCEFIGGCFS